MSGGQTLSELRAVGSVTLADGASSARRRAAGLDSVLTELIEISISDGVAVAAVGGYGRAELWPHSDVDLLFVSGPRSDVTPATIRGLLYPLWDAGWQVGHAVRTTKGSLEQASTDLHAATALLSARFLGGDRSLYDELLDRRERWLRRDARKLTTKILAETEARHGRSERAGWSLAPDLKDDIGGFRDLHTLAWLDMVGSRPEDPDRLVGAAGVLSAVREALHGEVSRKTDRMRLDLQAKVAATLGLVPPDGTDRLMSELHSSARLIEAVVGLELREASDTVLGGPRRSGRLERLDHGVLLDEGVLGIEHEGSLEAAMWLLAEHARSGKDISRSALNAATATLATATTSSWGECTAPFLAILRGPHAASALELLDRSGALVGLIPEWARIRGRAQHDLYHRYTVDGHSFIAVAEVTRMVGRHQSAGRAADEAGDLDALYLAALFHDIGKGSGGDHSTVGAGLSLIALRRMDIPERTAHEVATLVEHHLLLSETATRRDLGDGSVIRTVADKLGSPRLLRLLYVLSAADGRATGPEAWTAWKETLVGALYAKALVALETGEVPERGDVTEKAAKVSALEPELSDRAAIILGTLPPSYLDSAPIETLADELKLLARPLEPGSIRTSVSTEGDHPSLTVCLPDRPGTLARTAGVLALHRISVLSAQAYSTSTGVALERFLVMDDDPDWDKVVATLEDVYGGRLALDAHLERKAADYRPANPIRPVVEVLQAETAHSTVIEVRSPDALGLLYALTAGLSDLDLDIHTAKIDTVGDRVVDVFYVRTARGTKLDEQQAAEVERSILHRTERLFGS